jgi:hypothetical protein
MVQTCRDTLEFCLGGGGGHGSEDLLGKTGCIDWCAVTQLTRLFTMCRLVATYFGSLNEKKPL